MTTPCPPSGVNRIEAAHDLAVLPLKSDVDDRDDVFYPQFPAAVRAVAQEMARHYEVFYCLEIFIRDLVRGQLEAQYGDDWWDQAVPPQVKENVSRNLQREIDAGVTQRSDQMIDYSTFGELSVIIDSNWDHFGELFNSRKGLASVLARLNLLRGPIAHCSALSEDEVLRLRLSVADWFRLMQ